MQIMTDVIVAQTVAHDLAQRPVGIIANPMRNGETIRLHDAIRLASG